MSLQPAAADTAGFRAALGSFAAGVNVISLWDADGTPQGMTATAFTSVSTDPLLVLFCVNRANRSYQRVARTGRFGVNILGTTAREVSDHCARPGSDKTLAAEWLAEGPEWHSPALTQALAFLDCETEQDVSAGTHAVLIGRVRGIGLARDEQAAPAPLIHFKGAYRELTGGAPTSRTRQPAHTAKEYA
ncbi:NADH-FMN oxidoreductase RutF, flavin reductase (DIM6/NTAB) family [Streptomyces zhaozhouensis]|uniref:NADH-FMN oxidoreductase RutF, flavin reductase (DIM6/NTAB) family n=1 Tax=Streptomyces zhaozhouensis TaxID=1300267 RepID=A0A286DP19_9ACTN|nr:flavin reductase family protein [Streptomyces zhaozhouensis]SOD60386.1 NADH-FMN oxidoreductase RutF, flavin reductase (DIM6/NTAB) family [Streptomyces zhaozhouensis]